MGRGRSKAGGGFLRFGNAPAEGKSINFLKLTTEQRQDVMDMVSDGSTPEEAVKFLKANLNSWANVNVDELYEEGLSVFVADKDGLPKLENLQQARSMASRIDKPLYSVQGTQIGTGQDGEPLLKKYKMTNMSVQKSALQNKILSSLKNNYLETSGKFDKNGDPHQILSFTDWNTGEKSVVYMGIEFKKPKSAKW